MIYEYLQPAHARYSLYNLAADPSESNNLAPKNTKQLRTMMHVMIHELESLNAVYPVNEDRVMKPEVP